MILGMIACLTENCYIILQITEKHYDKSRRKRIILEVAKHAVLKILKYSQTWRQVATTASTVFAVDKKQLNFYNIHWHVDIFQGVLWGSLYVPQLNKCNAL